MSEIRYPIKKLISRTGKDFEFTFDGIPYKVPADKGLLVPEDCARHGIRRSLIQFDPMGGTATFALGIEGEEASGPLTPKEAEPRAEAMVREETGPGKPKVLVPLKGAKVGAERASGGNQSIIAKPTE